MISLSNKVQSILRAAGLKVATQNYEYTSAGISYKGQNVYAIINAPRGDATEAIVLVVPWKTADGELNLNAVTLALTLARYFKSEFCLIVSELLLRAREQLLTLDTYFFLSSFSFFLAGWSLWSKDIIFIFPPDTKTGTQAWIDAYHDMHPATVQPLPLKSGALQGAVVIEYPFEHRFESLHIVYDGVNGQLPNLDLFNTAISIASGQMGIGASLQEMWDHDDSYQKRLETILRGMVKQGFGYATGAHSSFMPDHIDAITIQTKGDGWQDEMALGRTVESICRSLNNLLEHLHQSFFFYLLMQANRFVSIGTYLPSAMLIAGNFTIMAIAVWLRTGYHLTDRPKASAAVSTSRKDEKSPAEAKPGVVDHGNSEEDPGVIERQLALPLTLVIGLHLLGLIPLYIFNNLLHQVSNFVFVSISLGSSSLVANTASTNMQLNLRQYFPVATYTFVIVDLILPLVLAAVLTRGLTTSPAPQQYLLIKSFSLLLLGLFLSTLATLNFSLSFMIGILCAPFSFISPIPRDEGISSHPYLRRAVSAIALLLMNALSPPVVLLVACDYFGVDVEKVLVQAAFGWDVWGMWTQVVVWCVWWPSWLIGGVLLGSSLLS